MRTGTHLPAAWGGPAAAGIFALLVAAACSAPGSPLPSTLGSSSGAELLGPEGLALDAQGRLYVSDFNGNHVFRVEPEGGLTVVAGNGTSGLAEDGVSALEAPLGEPTGIAFGPDGTLYIMDHHNHRVRRVDADGNLVTVAGSGATGQEKGSFAGDGGPATEARLSESIGLAFDGDGNLYIADNYNHRVRRVDHSGVIGTVAGSGAPAGSTPIEDGMPALEAALGYPWFLAFGADGSLYFTDVGRNALLRMDPQGRLHQVPVDVRNPNGVGLDADGNIYVADTDHQRIIKIAPDGSVSTIAGDGTAGFGGDGGPATESELDDPFGLVVDAQGNVFVADGANHRVRKIDSAGIITTVAGG